MIVISITFTSPLVFEECQKRLIYIIIIIIIISYYYYYYYY
jgi:hypothetical protein